MEKPRNSFKIAKVIYKKLLEESRSPGWDGEIRGEDIEKIKYSPQIIYKVSRHVLRKGSDIPKILLDMMVEHKSPRYSYLFLAYSFNIPEEYKKRLETIISMNPIYSCKYARLVLKGPFKEGEVTIFKSSKVRDMYVNHLNEVKNARNIKKV